MSRPRPTRLRVLCFVDTGGCELVLDERLAARVGATRVSSMRGEYGGRRRARTGLGWVDAVEAGDLRIGDVPVHTLDLGGFPDHFGLDVRGIVGTRLLMRASPRRSTTAAAAWSCAAGRSSPLRTESVSAPRPT